MRNSPLCIHEIGDLGEPTSLRPIIKVPKKFMTEQEKKDAEFVPDSYCIVCGRKFLIDLSVIKGVSCIRKTK